MKILNSINETQTLCHAEKLKQKKIIFIPTMGYLHDGHQSLMNIIDSHPSHFKVVSIFVNPTQFGLHEDFDKYPRNIESDIEICRNAKINLLFLPNIADMYPKDFQTKLGLSKLPHFLCGQSRPGHFDGVTQVVCKLFNITSPDIAIFGQKDFQQVAIIKQMVKDLNFNIKIVMAPTKRDENGLALSSRNTYLSENEKNQASHLYKSLLLAKSAINTNSNIELIKRNMKQYLLDNGFNTIDYFSIASANNLEEISPEKIETEPIVIACAAFIGKTRLIDNILIERNL